jgi:hypothetical protein
MASQVIVQAMEGFMLQQDQQKVVITEVVSGGATGVDELGEAWAKAQGIPITQFLVSKADWDTYGKSAGPRRNRVMAAYGDALLAIWDGASRGTANMIAEMRSLGKPTIVWRV